MNPHRRSEKERKAMFANLNTPRTTRTRKRKNPEKVRVKKSRFVLKENTAFDSFKKRIKDVGSVDGFENLQSMSNELNFDFTLKDHEKKKLRVLIELKRSELNLPENIRKRQEDIRQTLAEAAIRKKKEKEDFSLLKTKIAKANTKNKLTRLSNKIDKDPNIKNKFELLDLIRKKKRTL